MMARILDDSDTELELREAFKVSDGPRDLKHSPARIIVRSPFVV